MCRRNAVSPAPDLCVALTSSPLLRFVTTVRVAGGSLAGQILLITPRTIRRSKEHDSLPGARLADVCREAASQGVNERMLLLFGTA